MFGNFGTFVQRQHYSKNVAHNYIICVYLWRSNARTVPSREQLSTTLPEVLKQTPVTPDKWSEKVTKQNPEVVFQSFTCREENHYAHEVGEHNELTKKSSPH